MWFANVSEHVWWLINIVNIRNGLRRFIHLEMTEKKVLCVGLTCLDIVTDVAAYPIEDTDQRYVKDIWVITRIIIFIDQRRARMHPYFIRNYLKKIKKLKLLLNQNILKVLQQNNLIEQKAVKTYQGYTLFIPCRSK